MAHFVEKLKNSKNKFVKNVVNVASGTLVAQFVSFFSAPVLSRIFSPEQYGAVAVFSSILAICSCFSTFQYASAIMLDKEEKNSKSTVKLCFIFSLLMIPFVSIGCVIYYICFSTDFLMKIFLILLPLEVCMSGIISAADIWMKRKQKYSFISSRTIILSFISLGFYLVFGLLGWGAVGLLLGGFFSMVINCFIYFVYLFKATDYKDYSVDWHDLKAQISLHYRFPLFQLPSAVMNTASVNLPMILFQRFFGTYEVGGYSKANSLLSMPMSLIGTSVGTVFYQEAARLNHHGTAEELKDFTLSTYKKLVLLGVVPMSLVFGFGDYIFRFFLGVNWVDAGNYARILSPWLALTFTSSPLSSLMFVKNRQRENFVINVVLLVSRLASIIICGILGFSFFFGLIVFSSVGTVIWLFINAYILKLADVPIHKSTFYVVKIYVFSFFCMWLIRFFLV